MNCGDPTPGEYCRRCGQRKVDVRVSVRTLLMDVLEDQFLLDRRLPRTLGALLFRPGFLTVEHIRGRIVRYIHPFRLYLVSSLVFFVLLSFFSIRLVRRALDDDSGTDDPVTSAQAAAVDSALAEARDALADTTLRGDEREEVEARLGALEDRRRGLRLDSLSATMARLDSSLAILDRAVADSGVPAPVRAGLEANRAGIRRQRDVAEAQRAMLSQEAAGDTVAAPGSESTTLAEIFRWDESPPSLDTPGPPAADSALAHQIRRLGEMEPREAALTITATFLDYVPIMMFVLLPVFAGVLKLLYIRRGRFYAEHFVFLLHVHSFVFVLATVILLARPVLGRWVEPILGTWLLVYIYVAMKRVYRQGWVKTFAKYWTLGWMYFWILLASTGVAFVAALLFF